MHCSVKDCKTPARWHVWYEGCFWLYNYMCSHHLYYYGGVVQASPIKGTGYREDLSS